MYTSKLKQETLHEMELALDTFYNTLEPLEEYVGKMDCYSDWSNRRQIYRKIIQDSNDTFEGFEDTFLTNLFVFKTQIRKKPDDFREKLKQEFYKWIDATGINVNNCPEKLKHFLFEINEVLEGRGDNIVNQTRGLIKGQELTPQEALGMFNQLNHPLNKGREREEVLKGKKWNYGLGVKGEGKIRSGDPDRGKKTLEQICQEIASRHGNYDLFSEQKKVRGIQEEVRWDLIIEIQQNKDDWEIRKETITYDRYGGEKKDDVLILKTVRLGSRDYNRATGELINQPGKVYRRDYFSEKEWAEIIAIFGVSIQIDQELVDKINRHKNEFSLEKLLVSTGGADYDEEEWLIHNSAERKSDKNGCLVFDPDKMVKIKNLNEAEKRAIGYKSESGLQANSSSITLKNDDKGIGKGGIIAIVGVASALLIGSAVVVKKRLNKKVKKV